MLPLMKTLQNRIKIKSNSLCIDNWAFKLHYRLTSTIFFVATVLVTSREYIGERIRCMPDNDNKDFRKVIETFCFVSTTFTVMPDYERDRYMLGVVPHPGVIPWGIFSRRTIQKHMYYQWVPFLLFGQGIMFYLTHLLWKNFEDRRINKIVGLSGIRKIKEAYLGRSSINKSWASWYIFFEFLNLSNVIFQIYLTNKFLGGQFVTLGPKILTEGSKILNQVFPKVTKCTFHKYGASGSIQLHDSLCVMALNVVNEKIYVFLWFWFLILLCASSVILIWRFLTICLFSKSVIFGQMVFGFSTQRRVDPWVLRSLFGRNNYSYSDWLLLRYISKNIDGASFGELLENLCEECGGDEVKLVSFESDETLPEKNEIGI